MSDWARQHADPDNDPRYDVSPGAGPRNVTPRREQLKPYLEWYDNRQAFAQRERMRHARASRAWAFRGVVLLALCLTGWLRAYGWIPFVLSIGALLKASLHLERWSLFRLETKLPPF